LKIEFFRTGRALASACLLQSLTICAAVADDYTVTGTGWAFCHDGTDNTDFPLAGARVQLMDSDCDGSTICDDVMGESYVGDDGSFSVTGAGGDPGDYSWSRPDVYIRVVFNDDHGVRLTDELDRDQWFDTPEHDHNNTAGGTTVNFGAWTTGLGVSGPSSTSSYGDGTKCAVWKKAHDAYNGYIKLMGALPPAGHYDVEYWSAIWAGTPWTNTDTTHWPIHFGTWASVHEFGHSVRHAADGDGNHFTWDATRFRYARSHDICDPNVNRIGTDTHDMDLAYGFNEGWAEFWEGRTGGCWSVSIDPALEGNVAFALNVIAQEPWSNKKAMVNVLLAHPGAIHSLDEFTGFYAPVAAVAKQHIQDLIASAPKLQAAQSKIGEFAPVTYERQAEAVGREIDLLLQKSTPVMGRSETTLATPPQPPVALVRLPHPANSDGCGAQGCEALFRSAVAPAILKGEASLRELEVQRLRSSMSRETMVAMERREADGTLNAYLAEMRAREREAVLTIVARELSEAGVVLQKTIGGTPSGRELGADLRAKLARIERLRESKAPLPPGVGVMAILPEDVPVRTVKR
jgi:hypothetical protein